MKWVLIVGAIALAACASANGKAPVAPPAKAAIGAFGVDLDGRDLSVKPGDDFVAYSGGTWAKANAIPTDRSRWGAFDQLRDKAETNVRDVVQTAAASHAATGNGQKIADFYNSFLDTATIDKLGLAPAAPGLKEIAALKTHEQVAALIARGGFAVNGPISIFIDLDEKNPDRYMVGITQSGLSLPDREYYLKDTAEFKEIRAKFQAHVARMLTLAKIDHADVRAKNVLAIETGIAGDHWDIAARRERDKTYNIMSVAELKALAPAYPWDAALKSAGLAGIKDVIVREKSAIPLLATNFKKTPVAKWRDYLTYSFLSSNASVLPSAIDEANFDFYGKTLNGQPQQRERWKRGISALDSALGEAVGQLYVAKNFTPESKAKMESLVENLREAYKQRFKTLAWMTPETRAKADEKLASFKPKIAYPDHWRDYGPYEVKAGDAFGNKQRSAIYNWNYDLARLGKPSDRDEWFMTPQTVNAYYNPVFNEVVFPAAILQPPFFDANADPAVNYGAIGAVIGHEMGHGFDDQGAKSDARGVLHTWWSDADVKAFKLRTDALADQYSAFEALPGLHINGRLTLGENIGDNGGLTIAHVAYINSLHGKPAPVIDGLTGDQRFFLAYAQVWRTLYRDQALRNQVMSDPHSPGQFRANGVVRNMDEWYAAFGVKPGDKLYLAPDKRVHIW